MQTGVIVAITPVSMSCMLGLKMWMHCSCTVLVLRLLCRYYDELTFGMSPLLLTIAIALSGGRTVNI